MKLRWISLAALLFCGSALADFVANCTAGCIARPAAERSPNLLLLNDEPTSIELTWTATTPLAADTTYHLRAGNPAAQDNLVDLGVLTFAQSNDAITASRRFSSDDLGHGTFIAVLLEKRGSKTTIADWRAFRIVRLSELEAQMAGPAVGGALSIDLVPTRLQVSSGHGELPLNTGGNERVWWSVPQSQADADLDIDGESTGVPGVKITHSAPWESRGDDWRQSIRDNLPGVKDHFIDFEEPEFNELKFNESKSREAELQNRGTVLIKHYYSAITLFTNASSTILTARDLGLSGSKRYFAHETTANFKQKAHPKLWSSYSRHQYSADAEMLELIMGAVESRGFVPGLGHVQQDDGDGGSAIYKVGFKARAAPWSVPDDPRTFLPGFIHLDVVAVRTGFGGIETQADADAGGLCKLIGCGSGTKLDLSSPPRGYEVAAPMVVTGTQSGTLLMMQGTQLIAQREDLPPNPIELPAVVEFAVAAHLRAGALVRKKGFFNTAIEDVVPINSYVQFVVKYTVGMTPQTEMVVSDEAILPKAAEFDTTTLVVPKKSLWEKFRDLLGWPGIIILAVVGLLVLAFFLPGAARLVNAVLKMFAALIERITGAIGRK